MVTGDRDWWRWWGCSKSRENTVEAVSQQGGVLEHASHKTCPVLFAKSVGRVRVLDTMLP